MKAAVVAGLLATLSCNPIPAPQSPSDGLSRVARVCARLRALGCEEGAPTAEGASCEEVYQNALTHGVDLASDPACVERSKTCEETRACP